MKQNNDKNYKKCSQEVTLHVCIQYSRPIALSKIFLVLLPPDAHITDTGLDPSTSPIHFYNTCTRLFSSTFAFAPSLHCPLLLRYMHMVTRCDTHHLFGCPLALYANLCTSRKLYSFLASPFPEHCGSICLLVWEGTGIKASLVV